MFHLFILERDVEGDLKKDAENQHNWLVYREAELYIETNHSVIKKSSVLYYTARSSVPYLLLLIHK